MVVTASMSDKSTKEVLGTEYTISPTVLTADTSAVVISYGGKTATVAVTVTDGPGPVQGGVKEAYEAGKALTGGHTDKMTFEGVVVGLQGNSFFVQDGDYAVMVYNVPVEGIAVGKKISVTAHIQNYKGLVETWNDKNDESTAVVATLGEDGTLPAAKAVTTKAELDALNCSVLLGKIILEVVEPETAWTENANSNWKVKLNGEEVTLSLNKYTYNQGSKDVLSALKAGDTFSITNSVVGCYNNVNQISSLNGSTFKKEGSAPVKEVQSIEVTNAPQEVYVNGKISLSSVELTVTYTDGTSDLKVNPEEIIVDTSKVSESVVATVSYGGKTTTFTVEVKEKTTPVGETTVTSAIMDVSDGISSGSLMESFEMDDVITCTAGTTGENLGNNGKVYDVKKNNVLVDRNWRFYHTDGGKLTISANGATITSITITYTVDKKGYLELNGATIESDTATAVDATSIDLIVMGGESDTKQNGQARISAISVTYVA